MGTASTWISILAPVAFGLLLGAALPYVALRLPGRRPAAAAE